MKLASCLCYTCCGSAYLFYFHKATAFNLEEGAKSILDILDKTVASTVVIFVRTSGTLSLMFLHVFVPF